MTNLDAIDVGFTAHEPPIAEGEIILLGPNGGLAVQVIAVRDHKAWVRDLDHDRDGVLDLASVTSVGLCGTGGVQ